MNDPQIVPLFSQPLYINKIKLNQSMTDAVINTTCNDGNEGYNNGWMSDTQWLTTQPEIRSIIEEHLSQYVFDTLAVDNTKHTLEHASSWVNLHKPGDSSGAHTHSNSMFSGVMYFKVPPNSGDILFRIQNMIPTWCTETLYPEVTEYNQYNMREARIPTEDGMILLFPSHLEHSVTLNNSSDRYSMAFNYILRGQYGMRDTQLVL
tara:strand:+ start:809 stop:1426 length:618 start_codon:yes stop_codon:yes gene_type:complete